MAVLKGRTLPALFFSNADKVERCEHLSQTVFSRRSADAMVGELGYTPPI
jgi:hypothetical protein